MEKRSLGERFLKALTGGELQAIGQAIAQDDTLMPGLRGTRLDVYYRGGVLFQLFDNGDGKYFTASYDESYGRYNEGGALRLEHIITDASYAAKLASQIYDLKRQIDQHRFNAPKNEREVQQLIARENNLSTVAHETDYFIADIEVSDTVVGARFDMVAVRWKNSRKGGKPVMVPVLIELKHGLGALQGASGLSGHLADMRAMVANKPAWRAYLVDLQEQLAQMAALRAMTWNRSSVHPHMRIDMDARPEVLFILANYNSASIQLLRFLDKIEDPLPGTEIIDLRFAVSSFAGYGLYGASVLGRGDFRTLVNSLLQSRGATR